MKRFFVHLERNLIVQNLSTAVPDALEQELVKDNFRRAEILLEKMVMGDEYDSTAFGENAHRSSRWITHLTEDCEPGRGGEV